MQLQDDVIKAIYQVIQERKQASPESSYTASLMAKGIDKILKKVGEESAELIIAGKGGSRAPTLLGATLGLPVGGAVRK